MQETAWTVGLLLAAGAFSILLASLTHIPKVTLYILFGLILGPSVLGWIKLEAAEALKPVKEIALALVMFDLGSRLSVVEFRGTFRKTVPVAFCEQFTTFLLVGLGLFLLGLMGWVESMDLVSCLVLGVLAISIAPATTVLILQDYQSEGPITQSVYTLVALSNVMILVIFEVVLLFLKIQLKLLSGSPLWSFFGAFRDLLAASALGIIAGLLCCILIARTVGKIRFVFFSALLLLLLGFCLHYRFSYMLTFLIMGLTAANLAEGVGALRQQLERLGVLLYILFFVIAGVDLNLTNLRALGAAGIAYIVLRTLGKYLGAFFGARWVGESPAMQRWLGLAILSQAGAAIGLVDRLVIVDAEFGRPLQALIVGTVVFFELAGPLLLTQAIIRGGEVPLVHLVQPHGPSWRDTWRDLWDRFQLLLGREPLQQRPQEIMTVGHLMRRNVKSLRCTAHFPDIIDFIEQSRFSTYPVVDSSDKLLGVIRYQSIRSEVFDPQIANLVIAEDLAEPERHLLTPEQPLTDALSLFERSNISIIPVVNNSDPNERKLVGLVERRDVLRYAKRLHERTAQRPKVDTSLPPLNRMVTAKAEAEEETEAEKQANNP